MDRLRISNMSFVDLSGDGTFIRLEQIAVHCENVPANVDHG
jgi:hypothetical protein